MRDTHAWRGVEFTAHNFQTSSFYHIESDRCLGCNIVNFILAMARDVHVRKVEIVTLNKLQNAKYNRNDHCSVKAHLT
jgi:hypothetical protein